MRPIGLSPAEIDAIAGFVAFPNPGGTAAVTPAARPNPGAMKNIASGDRFVAAKDDKLALYAYLDAVNLDPTNVEARLKLAAQYLRMGHPAQAAVGARARARTRQRGGGAAYSRGASSAGALSG